MDIPSAVLLMYIALAVWAGILVFGIRRQSYRPFLLWGIAIMLFLNIRYLVSGSEEGIANFVALYDFFDNLGLGRDEGVLVPTMIVFYVGAACTILLLNAGAALADDIHRRPRSIVNVNRPPRCCRNSSIPPKRTA